MAVLLVGGVALKSGEFFYPKPAHADAAKSAFKREVFLCFANGLTMAAFGGGASVLAINATRAIVLWRASRAAAKAVTFAEYTLIAEGAEVTAASLQVRAANLVPSVATAFITTCAGGFTLFFFKDLANKFFPAGPTSDADGAAFAAALSQNPSVACSVGAPDGASGLCFDGNQYYAPSGAVIGGTICSSVSATAAFDSFSGLCKADDGSFVQPDGTAMGTCVIGFPTGSGTCINDDNTIYDTQGNHIGYVTPPPASSDPCTIYVATEIDTCTPAFAIPDTTPPTPTPTATPRPVIDPVGVWNYTLAFPDGTAYGNGTMTVTSNANGDARHAYTASCTVTRFGLPDLCNIQTVDEVSGQGLHMDASGSSRFVMHWGIPTDAGAEAFTFDTFLGYSPQNVYAFRFDGYYQIVLNHT